MFLYYTTLSVLRRKSTKILEIEQGKPPSMQNIFKDPNKHLLKHNDTNIRKFIDHIFPVTRAAEKCTALLRTAGFH